MGFQLSPSVQVKEIDLSTIVPAVATSICAVAGEYEWGPCFDRKLITNQKELINIFGYPNDNGLVAGDIARHWFSASNFLDYGNTLYMVRAIDPDVAKNAGLECLDDDTGGVPIAADFYIPNEDAVESAAITFTSVEHKAAFYAKYPGTYGNRIKIAIANSADWATAEITTGGKTFATEFEFSPSSYDAVDIANYFGIVVLLDDVIVEQHILSFDSTAEDFEGKSLYFANYLAQYSSYILGYKNASGDDTDAIDSFVATALLGGLDGSPAAGDIQTGYEMFANDEELDINMVIDGGNANIVATQQYIIDNVSDVRKDCVAILSVPSAAVVNALDPGTATTACTTFKNTTLARSSSYAAVYGNWKYQYDRFNDKYRWMPISGDAAGIYAHTDEVRDAWYAPAGPNRGRLKNVTKLAFNPNRANRDLLYKSQVNPVVNFAGEGPMLFGQKTCQTKPSAFDRVDVRRLFIVLEKAISTSSRYFLFEKNTAFIRSQLKGMIEPFLRTVQGREGIYEFHVECSEVNNTPDIIDTNMLVCDIYIQPTKTAEYISLNFIATRTGVDFNEFIGKVQY